MPGGVCVSEHMSLEDSYDEVWYLAARETCIPGRGPRVPECASLETRNKLRAVSDGAVSQNTMFKFVRSVNRSHRSRCFVQLIVRIALDAPYPTPTSHVSVHRSARQRVCLSPGRGGVGVSRGACLRSAKYQPCTPRVPWGNQPAK